jgi:hypothetical protein
MNHPKNRQIYLSIGAFCCGLLLMFVLLTYILPPKVETLLLETSNEFNRKCPMMVDKITRFDNTSVGEKELRFSYTILNALKDSVDSIGLHNYLEPIVKKGLTNNPKIGFLRQNHITIACLYKDRSGKILTEIRVTPEK